MELYVPEMVRAFDTRSCPRSSLKVELFLKPSPVRDSYLLGTVNCADGFWLVKGFESH